MKSFKLSSYTEEQEKEKVITELREKKIEEKIRHREKNRTEIEKFSVKELGDTWSIISGIALFICMCVAGIDFYINKELIWYSWILLIELFLFGFAFDLKESWEKKIKIKSQLREEDKNYRWGNNLSSDFGEQVYESDYIFTDSSIKSFLYSLYKVSAYIITVLAIICVAILLFSLLGTISIAPTTIIIILLVIIIFNQR